MRRFFSGLRETISKYCCCCCARDAEAAGLVKENSTDVTGYSEWHKLETYRTLRSVGNYIRMLDRQGRNWRAMRKRVYPVEEHPTRSGAACTVQQQQQPQQQQQEQEQQESNNNINNGNNK